MSYRLGTIFYVFALVAAALATFGPVAGIFAVAIVLGFWGWWIYRRQQGLGWPEALLIVFLLLVLAALLLPAVSSARQAALRSQCMNNLKQIVLALLNYELTTGRFPPAYDADAAGKPMHSWRVLILPYMEYGVLFKTYNFFEPWDGPNNSKLAAQMPDVYRCPSHEDHGGQNKFETDYLVVTGPETMFPSGATGRTIASISDGTSRTIAVIEASGLGIHWMEPRDLTIDEAVELLTKTPHSGHRHVHDGFLTTTYYDSPQRYVAFCDGHVEWMGQLADAEIARALLTGSGGEQIPQSWEMNFVEPKSRTVVKWGKVWGLAVFLALAVLPVWMRRAKKQQHAGGKDQGPGETPARG